VRKIDNTRVGVYVDAFNVYYGGRGLCGRHAAGWRWLDLGGLAMDLIDSTLWPGAMLTRLVYCTAPRDREGDPSSLADQLCYIAALQSHCVGTVIINGRYAPRTKTGVVVDLRGNRPIRVPSPGFEYIPLWLPAKEVRGPSGGAEVLVSVSAFEEKGSDVNVASSLLIDVLTGVIDAAIVFSNDSDLEFPLSEARLHVPVATVNPSGARRPVALSGKRDDGVGRHWWRTLSAADFRDHQMPEVVGDHRRPAGW